MGEKNPDIFKNEQVVEQQDYLIIEEILTRLPIKSILRFKSVSKQWYSILSSSNFAISHFIKSPFSHPSAPVNTLFIWSSSNCYLFSYDDQISGHFEDHLVKLDPEFWVDKDVLKFTGCCNGLICLTPLSYKYFIIWNPATRKVHKFEADLFIKRSCFLCGFGYASSVDDTKYVRISVAGLGIEQGNNIVHIFSLRENKWRRLDYIGLPFIYGPPVLISEKFHWPAICSKAGPLILRFDLGVEMFDRVNLDREVNLGVMGGCLSSCNFSNQNRGDMVIHIFESPGVILKSVSLPEGLRIAMASQVIGFTRTGKFFVTGPSTDEIWDSHCTRLGIVDTATKPMQYTPLFWFDEMIKIARYVPSLVSPFPIEELSRA